MLLSQWNSCPLKYNAFNFMNNNKIHKRGWQSCDYLSLQIKLWAKYFAVVTPSLTALYLS